MLRLLIAFCLIALPSLASDPYKPDVGPYGVSVDEIALDVDGRTLPLRVTYPDGTGPFPLVVLSHGGGCQGGSYSAVGDHWTAHGYVVIQPTHPDSASLGFDMATVDPRQMEGIIQQRVQDLSIVIDRLADIESVAPGVAGKIDAENIVAAGHSMGGATALLATGMVIANPFSRQQIKSDESRYDALLLLSEPGHNPTLPEEPWRTSALPTFVYTGTFDRGSQSNEDTTIPFQYQLVSVSPDPAPPRYHLWIDDVDHFLSGAWCRPAAEFDQVGLSILRGVSTAFLDAYAKNDADAQAFLNSADLPDYAGPRPTLSLP